MAFLGYYLLNWTRNTEIDQLESQLASEAKLISDISLPYFADSSANSQLDALAKSLGKEISTRITFISPDGVVLGDTDQDPSTMENHGTRPEVASALTTGSGRAIRYSTTLHENMMYVAISVSSQGSTEGIIRAALPMTAVQDSVTATTATMAGAVALVAVFVILATILIAGMLTRPVRRITKAAEAIASGKLDQQIDANTDDEIGRLGHAFNEMAVNIKNTMAVLDSERNRLVSIISVLKDGVIMTGPDTGVILVNPAAEKLFNIKQDRVTGRPIIEVIPDYEVDNLVKACVAENAERSIQLDSNSRFLRIIAAPIATGEIKGCLVLFQDLTEMRSLQTMRREFVGNVSHEIRTPLAAMKAISETLRDGALYDQLAAKDFLERLDVELDGMTQMVNELIELSRIETGTIKLKLEPVDLNALVKEVANRLKPQADRNHLTLSTNYYADLPTTSADRERVRQVITNILHNAIKFTPPQGKILVSTRQEGQTIIAEVSDTGIGIAAEDLPHIFERFFKADKSRSTTGTGLGLAIAKHTIQAHGGNIWVTSEPRKRFCFRIQSSDD